jgi:hypothetical protein
LIVDVQWYTELTGLNVFPLSSLDKPKIPLTIKSTPFKPKDVDYAKMEKKRLALIQDDI